MTRTVLSLLLLALACRYVRGDHAHLAGGQRIEGTLRLDHGGALAFDRRTGGTVALADVQSFHLAAAPPPSWDGPAQLLRLSAEEEAAGEFLQLRDERLVVRTGWADRLLVPRAGLLALTHLPGWRTLRRESLTQLLPDVERTGAPAFAADGVRLSRVGQALTWPVRPSLAEGRLGVTWQEEGAPAGARWAVDLTFAAKAGDRTLRILLAGADRHLTVEGSASGTGQAVARTATPRRLLVTFMTGSVRIVADDAVVWYTLTEGPGGALRQVRLTCLPANGASVRGAVRFAHLTLESAAPWPRRPPAEPRQDELWLASGDQVFGRVTHADADGLDLQARHGRHHFAWSELLGWYPRRVAPVTSLPGTRVRLELHSGMRPERDVLVGTLIGLDSRQAVLRHPLLGELTLPRANLASLRVLR